MSLNSEKQVHGCDGLAGDGSRLHEKQLCSTARNSFATCKRKPVKPETVSASAPRLQSLVTLAESCLEFNITKLDSHAFFLNVANGIVDLKTGKLLRHNREYYFTSMLPVRYQPNRRAPRWECFLQEVFPDMEVRDYFHRVMGYSLSDSVVEKAAFFWLGEEGDNGKTVAMEIFKRIFNHLAVTVQLDALRERRDRGISNDLVMFKGRRIVSLNEPSENFPMDTGRFKYLTGGDEITARQLHCEPISFQPTHKMHVLCNFIPDMRGGANDKALWSRIKIIPFTQSFAKNPDRSLAEKLWKERRGILAWLVEGCLKWQREGLQEPRAVKDAIKTAKLDADQIERYIEEMTVPIRGLWEEGQTHYAQYKLWTQETDNGSAISQKQFYRALRRKGFTVRRQGSKANMVWQLGLKTIDYDEEPDRYTDDPNFDHDVDDENGDDEDDEMARIEQRSEQHHKRTALKVDAGLRVAPDEFSQDRQRRLRKILHLKK
jgi:P4 family phage/plasmid primase-like protien